MFTPLANLLRPPDRGGQSVVVAKMIQIELQVDFRLPPVECFLQASTTRPTFHLVVLAALVLGQVVAVSPQSQPIALNHFELLHQSKAQDR